MQRTFNEKNLSLDIINSIPQIASWVGQFPPDKQITAKTMLSKLSFVSRDTYSNWLLSELSKLPAESHAIYAVRKLESSNLDFWTPTQTAVDRPSQTLGSEDLVYSIISNAVRGNELLLDHPSVEELLKNKIHRIIFIDDSIGSGDRVSEFINAFLKDKTIMSWWSYGFLRIKIISFARTYQSKNNILEKIRGSDHFDRKFRKSEKIEFVGKIVYDKNWMKSRWGGKYTSILDLCRETTQIHPFVQQGYGEVMGNLIFYHSVPDNIPGMFWADGDDWVPLFKNRAIPAWMLPFFDAEQKISVPQFSMEKVDIDLFLLLSAIKSGVKSLVTLSLRLNCDIKITQALILRAETANLISNGRLTERGREFFFRHSKKSPVAQYNFSMYIPSSWSIG